MMDIEDTSPAYMCFRNIFLGVGSRGRTTEMQQYQGFIAKRCYIMTLFGHIIANSILSILTLKSAF